MTFGKVRNAERQVVHLRHPGYDDDCNKLLTLYGFDHPDGGVHYETARIACGILAGNRWDGVLTPSAEFKAEDVPTGSYFIGRNAYFHLSDWQPKDQQGPEAQLKRRYPVLVRWDEWTFPHGNLPKIWQDVLPHPKRERKLKQESEVDTSSLEIFGGLLDMFKSLLSEPKAQDVTTATAASSQVKAVSNSSGDTSKTISQDNSSLKLLDNVSGLIKEAESGMKMLKAALGSSQNDRDLPDDPEILWHEREEEARWCQLCDNSGNDASSLILSCSGAISWFKKNRMWQYTEFKHRRDEDYDDCDVLREAQRGERAVLRVESDCHGERHRCEASFAMIRGQWAFVPKFEWCGQPRLVAQMLIPQYGEWEQDSDKDYWDKGIDTARDNPLLRPDRVALEMLFTGFARSLFYGLGDFLKAGVNRLLFIEDHNGVVKPREISAQICAELYLQIHMLFKDDNLWEKTLFSEKVNHDVACNGCDKKFQAGARYKCLEHEDFTYCSDCVASANLNDPDHAFIKLHLQPPEKPKVEENNVDENSAQEAATEGTNRSRSSSFSSSDEGESDESRQKWSSFLESDIDAQVETYRYLLLSPPEKDGLTVRLFTLWPGSELAPICGHLWTTDIREATFDALSYCWGDPSSKTSIMISGNRLAITQNLKSALHHLRDLCRPKILWIDAICINQEDNVEKAQQVSKMREIYSHAQQTIIWLGDRQDKSDKAIQMCRRIIQTVDHRFWRNLLNHFGADLNGLRESRTTIDSFIGELTDDTIDSVLHQQTTGRSNRDALLPDETSVGKQSMSSIEQSTLLRQLLHQITTMQDAVFPSALLDSFEYEIMQQQDPKERTEVLSDSRTEEVSRPGQEWNSQHRIPHTSGIAALLRRDWFSRVWIIQEVAVASKATVVCGEEQIDWWLLLSALILILVYTGNRPTLKAEPGIWSFTYIAFARQATSENRIFSLVDSDVKPGDLLGILQMFRRFNATNGRDKVYALLGLLPSNTIEGHLPVDYEESIAMTYIRASVGMILASKSLDVLSIPMRPEGSTLDLPSYIPDWSATGGHAKLLLGTLQYSFHGVPCKFRATKDSRVEIDAGDIDFAKTKFMLRGYEIDRLKVLCKPLRYPEKEFDIFGIKKRLESALKDFGSSEGDLDPSNFLESMVDVLRNVLDRGKEMYQTTDEWQSLALGEQTGSYFTGEDALTVFKTTLAADTFPHGWDTAERAFAMWNERKSFVKEILADLTRDLAKDPKTLKEVVTWLRAAMQAMVRSKKYTDILEPSSTITLHSLMDRAYFRKLGRTEKGLLALLPDGCAEGDVVVLLKGGKLPYIVRKVEGGYVFIGDSYVHGIMNGEFWDETKCQQIVLVS